MEKNVKVSMLCEVYGSTDKQVAEILTHVKKELNCLV